MRSSTIFRHLFKRVTLILLGINIVFSIILLPIYKDKLVRMVAVQGSTFANSTIAACGEALYTEDFSFIISYTRKILQQTPEISFISFTSTQGKNLKLTAGGWNSEYIDVPTQSIQSDDSPPYSIEHRNIGDATNKNFVFIFSKPIIISGLYWGSFTIALSDREYNELLFSYFRNVFIFSSLIVFITLILLHGSSRKLGLQLVKLRNTASKLASGDLSARVPTNAIGEIRLLATTLNGMAESLDENTRNMRRLARLVEDTNDAIAIFSNNSRIIFTNNALKNISDKDNDYFYGMTLPELFSHLKIEKRKQREVITQFTRIDQHDWSTDITITTSSHKSIHMTMRIEKFDIDEVESGGFFVVLSDITRRKQLEFELETLAYIDKLTKLPNRRFFMDRITEAVDEAEAFDSTLSLLFLDLDNFKIINDSLGHEVGDIVLSEAGWKIQDALRSDDVVCRLGGDEFTAIIRGVNDKKAIANIANTILKHFELPIYCKDRELRISASIGIVTYPEDGINTKELIKNADTAMYAAKKSGKNAYRFFSEEMHQDMRDFLDIESALRQAIASSEGLYVVYQPFVDFKTKKITHCEALLRWNHPDRGAIPPGKFIPIAEQSGLIRAIGEWVFNEVCRQLNQWQFNINVSVNVSGTELLDKRFSDRIQNTLIEYDIAPHRIQLEFTEHVLVSEEGQNLPILNQLKRTGFQLAIDDFGTGFSSLSYLTELPIDVIKIDKSFINRLPDDRKTIAVVNSIISLANNLGITTVGEGAEQQSQVEWLVQHGCNSIQGYYFYKPMIASHLEDLISKQKVASIRSHDLHIIDKT